MFNMQPLFFVLNLFVLLVQSASCASVRSFFLLIIRYDVITAVPVIIQLIG